MFFSAKELHAHIHENRYRAADFKSEFGGAGLKKVAAYVKACKQGIVARADAIEFESGKENDGHRWYPRIVDVDLWKWYRPWDVVPKLRDFQAPEGDYGIGVEVEMGFISKAASSTIANLVKNWRWIAVDIEGGSHPIEATFPPMLYSKMSSKSQVFRYLKLLRNNQGLVQNHSPTSHVGTHINISKGGVRFHYLRVRRISEILEYLSDVEEEDEEEKFALCRKYFGRTPYGGVYDQGGYLEYKLFNSTTDGKALKRYINIAIALTDLIDSDQEITEESVFAACELGYKK